MGARRHIDQCNDAHVPLSKVTYPVARLVEQARDSHCFRRQIICLALGRVGCPVVVQSCVDGKARWLATRHEPRPGGRADRRSRVKVAKDDTLLRPSVQVWRVTHRGVIEPSVAPAPVYQMRVSVHKGKGVAGVSLGDGHRDKRDGNVTDRQQE